MAKILPFPRWRSRTLPLDLPEPVGGIGPAPWDVMEFRERPTELPTARPRPGPPWPVYNGAHSVHQLAVEASEAALTLLGVAAGISAARAGQVAAAAGWLILAGLWWQWRTRRLCAWELGLRGEHALERALKRLRGRIPQLSEAVLLRELALRHGSEEFQIDYLLLSPCCAVILEAKHWSDLQQPLPGGRWSSAGRMRVSPLLQVRRQARLLEAWLASRPSLPRLPVVPLVVFTHRRAQTGELPPGAIPLAALAGALAQELATRLPRASAAELRDLAAELVAADACGGGISRCAG